MRHPLPRAVLFDLDGTLVDSAGDLLAALNAVRAQLGLPPDADPQLRMLVSQGALALLKHSIPLALQTDMAGLRIAFLAYYRDNICRYSQLYPGGGELLNALAGHKIAWGVVTNKPHALAQALLDQLGLTPGVLIGGDTLALCKPDPAPVLAACAALGVTAAQTWLLGDDLRDIQAARAAGCSLSFACSYGYVPASVNIADWGADYTLGALDLLSARIWPEKALA